MTAMPWCVKLNGEGRRQFVTFRISPAWPSVAMSPFDPQVYGPVFAPLVDIDRRRPLDAGTFRRDARSVLESLTVETAFARGQIADRDMATCCLSAVWLLHNELDESHSLSQQIDTPSGSFWHGIMHRREGDFSRSEERRV